MNRPYLIWTPRYSRSAGVQALYKLAHELEERGCEVYLWTWGNIKRPGYKYINNINRALKQEGIVVYPEVAVGNPLRFNRVARWVLYFPGQLSGEKTFYPTEKIFSWRPEYYPGAPRLYVNLVDKTLFYNDGKEKTQDYVFVHKGGRTCYMPELENLPEINMNWPKTRETLGEILRSCRTLYSFDLHTSILDEAYYSGAKVKMITQEGKLIDFYPGLVFEQNVFEREISFFINETQNMPASSDLQPLPPLADRILQNLRYKAANFPSLLRVVKTHPGLETFLRRFFNRGVLA